MAKANKQKRATENPLDKSEVKDLPVKLYSDEDKEYITFLQKRLEDAYQMKNNPHPEFNNKNYYQVYEEDEKIANTNHIDPKKNEDDVSVSSGTIEEKLDALLSHVNNLNLSGELCVYDDDKNEIHAVARAVEDIVHDTEVNEPFADNAGDEEKRIARQRELLVHGTAFVQEEWLRLFETKKVLKNSADRYSGKFKDVDWDESMQKVFEGPSRTLLYGPNVFLGNITEFYIERQPYIFIMVTEDYENVKSRYGRFENFVYVQKGAIPPVNASNNEGGSAPKTIFDNKWRLTSLKENQCEIIMYQDQSRNEFQIIINGVLMLPVGFPLSAVTPGGRYNIAKQVYRIINSKFAYGKSFVSSGSVKEISGLIDEMLKLFVLKTRKSIMPAYVNTSGRVIDRKVLSPGRISMGIDPGSLQPVAGNETQGITAGEANYLATLRDLVDKSTVSDQFTGNRGKTGTTATEVNTLQQQAQLTLGLTVAVCALLEKKLKYLRTYNILENWFMPIGDKVRELDDARKLVKQYRRTSREVNIEGAGMGNRSVYLTEGKLPTPDVVREMELRDERRNGKPSRKIFLNPTELQNARLIFQWVVVPKEKDSSMQAKVMFRQMLGDVIAMTQIGSRPNVDGIEEEAARVWNKPRSKFFQSSNPLSIMGGINGTGVEPGQSDKPVSPEQILAGQGQSNEKGTPMAPGTPPQA